MLTRNLAPFIFGTKVSSRRPPRLEMTLVVRGAFHLRPNEPVTPIRAQLGQGMLTAETFRDGDDERAGECLYGGDFADFKLNAEVIVRAKCHAPGGKPTTECPVMVRVGSWQKILRIVGPRVWTEKLLGASISDPEPFTTMDISYANAFGGPEYELNPAGKGHKTPALPTVLRAGDVVRSRTDRLDPAGFGPINPAWPQRRGKLGEEYGSDWRKTRWPFHAADLDWTYFSAAPPDQQLKGYLQGDEKLTFQNLHRATPIFTTRLPALRVRAFCKDVAGEFREIPMVLDTLYADLEVDRLLLTWRGLTPVRELDLADVKTLLIAEEPLAGERLPEAHYRAILEDFEDDPVGLQKQVPPGFLDFAERSRKEQAGEPVPAEPGDAELDPVSRVMKRRLGSFAQEEQARVREAMKDVMAQVGSRADLEAEMEKAAREAADSPPPVRTRKPGTMPNLGLRRQMRALLAQIAEIKKGLEGKPVSDEDRKKIEELEQIPHDPKWRALDPTYVPPEGPVSTDEPGPGRDLSEQDLTGRDLRGVDLRGANLEDAILTRANLTGCDLTGANLRRAVLFRADLTGANLTGCDLSRANAARVRAPGAILRGAKLDLTFFEDADLGGADLSGATGEYVMFPKANLTTARLAEAALPNVDLSETTLDQAVLAGAKLPSSLFGKCRGAGVDLRGADLSFASFEEASLPGAVLADCHADRSLWSRAVLDGADLSFATLRGALWTHVSAAGAKLFGADLRGARLDRARLDHAEIVRANLFSADLSHASIHGTRFTGSNLYDAKLVRTTGSGADFRGANLKRSTMEPT
jgi:uncharacterized protein YjbI with pentapeptide repeats